WASARRTWRCVGSSTPPWPAIARLSRRCSRATTSRGPRLRRPLPRQDRGAHQVFVHRPRALAAFADRPDHQRLAAPGVAAREHVGLRSAVAEGVGAHAAARIELDAALFDEAALARAHEAHG